MKRFKDINEVWNAIESGQDVYWSNQSYKLTIEPVNREWRQAQGFAIPFSAKGEFCLRVTCISNWFGSLLLEDEIKALFTIEGNQQIMGYNRKTKDEYQIWTDYGYGMEHELSESSFREAKTRVKGYLVNAYQLKRIKIVKKRVKITKVIPESSDKSINKGG